MKDLTVKTISRMINHVFIGILFVYVIKNTMKYDIIVDKDLTSPFIYYFIGIVISRIGSVLIEPALKLARFLKFANYRLYVDASKEDSKIELIARISEDYRTICSVFLTSLLLMGWNYFYSLENSIEYVFLAVLILFLLSYRKQVNYVTKRIDAFIRKKKEFYCTSSPAEK